MMIYFRDAAQPPRIHGGFVEHEELELTDAELARIKKRAIKAVTMDGRTQERPQPSEYKKFLKGGHK